MHVRCNYDWALIYSEQKKAFLWTLTAALRAVSKLHMHWVKAPAGRLIAARQKFQQLQKAKKIYIAWGQEQRTHKQFQMFQNKH